MDRNLWTNFAVQSEYPLRSLFGGCATTIRSNTDALQQLTANLGRHILDVPFAEDEHALAHLPQFRIVPVDPIDDDRAGHAIESLARALAMRMGVVPVQSRGGIRRYLNVVVERVPGS